MHASTSWTTLLRFPTVHEAEVARGALEAHEIPVQLLDTGMVGVADYLSNAIGGVRLQVPAGDEERAMQVLANLGDPASWDDDELEEAALAAGDAEDEENDDVELVNPADALARRAMVAALAGFFLPFVLHAYSVVLLASYGRIGTPASPRGRRHLAVAAALDALFLGPVLALAVRAFAP